MQNQFDNVNTFGGNDHINRRGSTGSATSQQSSASSYTISFQSQREGFLSKATGRPLEKHNSEKQSDRKCIVYLLDGHPIEFAYKNSLTAQELYDIVCSQLLLQEKEYFGLFTFDELRHKHWLDMKSKVTSCVLDSSKRHFEIYLGVKFFVLSLKRLRHFTTIELFYLQCRKLVFGGDLKADSETLFELAATALQEIYGDFESLKVTEDCLKSTPLLSVDAWSSEDSFAICEQKVADYHSRLVGKTRGEAILHYMNIAESLTMYGMHFYRVKGRPGCNPLWVSIGLMGLQEWTFKDDSTSTDSTHTNNDIRIPTSISKFDWSSISHIRHEKKELTIEVEQKDVDGYSVDNGSGKQNSGAVTGAGPKTPKALTIEDDSKRLFNMRTPILGRGGSGSWSSSRRNKTGVFSWSGKMEVTKTMFKLACEHHKFYLQYMLATNEEQLNSALTSPYHNWSPFLGSNQHSGGSSTRNHPTNPYNLGIKGAPGPLRSLQDVSAAELSNSELSINSSSGFSDSGLATTVLQTTTASYLNSQNNSNANNKRKESQSESCGGTASCSTSQSLSMLSGTSDLGPSLETLQDLVAAFSAQRDSLLDKLRIKLEQLKEVCLQESEITGKLPEEYPVSPGASPPPPRRRVGTAFQLSENVLLNMNQSQSLKRTKKSSVDTTQNNLNIKNLEEERLMLQTDVDIKTQIIEAEKKLLSENKHYSKRGKRKDKKQNILKMEAELRDMRLKLAQLSRDIERQKIQAYNVSLRAPAVDSDELFSIFNSPPRHEEETPAVDSGERNRAQSVSHRYKNHVGSTDALNSSPGNDLQQAVKEILSSRTESIIKSSPNSPVLNRNSKIYNGSAWTSSSRNPDAGMFPEEHENISLGSVRFDKNRDPRATNGNDRPPSPERRFTSDYSPSVDERGTKSAMKAERHSWKFAEEDEIAGYVPSGAYQMTNYRTTRYPTYSLKKLRHNKSEEDLLGGGSPADISSSSSSNNWRQPVNKGYQKTSTASLNAQLNNDRRESQLRSMTQMLSASSLGATANYAACGASNTSCASSNISNKEEHMSSRSSFSSLHRRQNYALPYTSSDQNNLLHLGGCSSPHDSNSASAIHPSAHPANRSTWQPERFKTTAATEATAQAGNIGITQSQSLQAFYGSISPRKSTFDTTVNYECDEMSLSSADGNYPSPQSATYDASSYYQRCLGNKKTAQQQQI